MPEGAGEYVGARGFELPRRNGKIPHGGTGTAGASVRPGTTPRANYVEAVALSGKDEK